MLKEFGIKVKSGDALFTKVIPGFMICNPPYGQRIKTEGKTGVFLKDALDKFLTEDKPERIGWLIPSDMDDLMPKRKDYKIRSKRKFRNGGLAVTYWILERTAEI